MSITEQHKKEDLGQAYIHAIIAQAGFNYGESNHDYGYDGEIKEIKCRNDGRRYESGYSINYQLKSTCDYEIDSGYVVYDLESKNYNDLVEEDTIIPKILILFALPADNSQWLEVYDDHLIIRNCAWWCSLVGESPTTNTAKKRIKIPVDQRLTPESLKELMQAMKGGIRR